ncbi:MAG: ABC transporter [Halochromatium sp.]|nr:ABC transporter [Halochromatium sp.]
MTANLDRLEQGLEQRPEQDLDLDLDLPGRFSRLNRPAADLLFLLLLILVVLLAGWLIARHDRGWDLTLSGRNSLSSESRGVLARLEEPIDIRIFAAPETKLARAIEQVLAPYRRASTLVQTQYIDPQLFPELARAADVYLQGQLVLEYQNRRLSLERLNERVLTNAIARLQLQDPPWIAVLEGHGERAIDGAAPGDLRRFSQLLMQRGLRLQPLDLAVQTQIPDNIDLLLISTPAIALFPGEELALVSYLERGGNLLWLLDPADPEAGLLGLEALQELLNIERLPGQIVDAAAGDLRLQAPTFAVVQDWPDHALTTDLSGPALFPGAVALSLAEASAWRQVTAFKTGALSWNETGPVRGEIAPDPDAGEQRGPLNVGLLLSRPLARAPGYDPARDPIEARQQNAPRQQRIAVIGDGDFLANAHLDQGANKALALQLVRWLAHREDLIAVPPPVNDRVALVLTPLRMLMISVGSLVVLPGFLALAGLGIYWSRNRA